MGAHLQAAQLLVLCSIPRGMLTLGKQKGQINSAIRVKNPGGKERGLDTEGSSEARAELAPRRGPPNRSLRALQHR